MGKINRARFQNVSPQGKVSSPLINPFPFYQRAYGHQKKSSAMEKLLYQCQIEKWYNFSTVPRCYSHRTLICSANSSDHKGQVPHCSGQKAAVFRSSAGDQPVLSFSGHCSLNAQDHFLQSCPQLGKHTLPSLFLCRQTDCGVAFHFHEFGVNLTKFMLIGG